MTSANSAEPDLAGGEKRRLEQQVFGRIAGDRQLAEHHDSHVTIGGDVDERVAQLLHVGVDGADGRVELAASDPELGH